MEGFVIFIAIENARVIVSACLSPNIWVVSSIAPIDSLELS